MFQHNGLRFPLVWSGQRPTVLQFDLLPYEQLDHCGAVAELGRLFVMNFGGFRTSK